MTATVYIVHCVDTEGPLYESPEVKIQRLMENYGISSLPATEETIEKLRSGDIDLAGKQEEVANFLNSHNQNYMSNWTELGEMLQHITDPKFRNQVVDSFGGGWVFNWFCVDHINYDYNPRRRATGFHAIFDHYKSLISNSAQKGDGLHWHFHPMSTYHDAHSCATHYLRSPEIYEILCRKIIEREWFPSSYRAGFQAERPDSNWFLEQWFPFDFTNMAVEDPSELDQLVFFRNGRSGDWRRAPADWSIYHPSHDDYQIPGNSRRWIARALNMINRFCSIDQDEMDKAFARAANGTSTLVGVTNHDYRNMAPEIDLVRDLAVRSAERFPDVKFKFAEARDAIRSVIGADAEVEESLDLEVLLHPEAKDDVPTLEIKTTAGSVFGPQPFLAIETKSRRFIHDNLDFGVDGCSWFYAFHEDTLPLEDVSRIGIAANDKAGNSSIKVLKTKDIIS